ncbi:DUF6470 family protein [Bacillus sp. CGMCC 1.16607]|uniref:DUF6470 family protein n=1 Tax=Bacillus sp. CGMCC 1.16607 TaxID=3351842 RepID=UPI00363FE340
MQLPRLEITNTNAILGLTQHRTKIEIKQPMAEVKMNQPQPEVEMYTSNSKLEIDQTEAFADANLKTAFRNIEEWVARSKRKISQNIAEEVSEGNKLMSIEHQRETVIPQIAKQESETPPAEIDFGNMPKSANSIKFHYQPSEIKIKVNTENLKVDVKTHDPIIKFNPGDLQIYLKQKASIHIKAIGTFVDQKI